jgi:putative DNA methylase
MTEFNKTIEAEPHTPVYKMHKYFARRPWNVFSTLVEQHSSADDIIMDPFMGGGVTVIESLRLKRKAIGIDVNPLATFITKMETTPLDINRFRRLKETIASKVKDEIQSFYVTKCSKCGLNAHADWLEWNDRGHKIKRIKFNCSQCNASAIKKPLREDLALAKRIDEEFDTIIQQRQLWFPKTQVPSGDKTSSLLKSGITHFEQLFTRRNLLALAILFKEMNQVDPVERDFLKFTFSSSLKWCSRQSHLRGRIVEGWAMHAYWVYADSLELNVWNTFERRFEAVIRGKKYSNEEIGSYCKLANEFSDLKHDASCLLLNRSASELSFPTNSIDAIITDPPYGANVNYGELADFWWIWLNDGRTIGKDDEAIINRTQRKSISEYEGILTNIFRECFRVLKPGRVLVSTFNSKNAAVVSSFIKAVSRAGFYIEPDGISYQKPIRAYTTTFHAMQVGAFVGDFIFTFTKPSEPKRHVIRVSIDGFVDFKRELNHVISEGIHSKMTDSQIREIAYKQLIPYIAAHTFTPDNCWQATDFFESRMRECSIHFKSRRESIIESRRNRFRSNSTSGQKTSLS